jgi:hypothetical protein
MLNFITENMLQLVTIALLAVLAIGQLRGNGVAGFKRAAGDAYKNKQRKAEQMVCLDALIDDRLGDPAYAQQTRELLESKAERARGLKIHTPPDAS